MDAKKTVLITGANKGIRFEIARQLGLLGWQVLAGARDRTRGAAAVEKLRAQGIAAELVEIDLSDPESIREAAQRVSAKLQRLDVLINNAGILLREDQRLLDASQTLLQQVIQTNAFGALQTVQAFLPLLHAGSRVIFMSSGGGSMTDPVGGWSPVYCVSKSLMNAIARHAASELQGKGIAVNAMCPGWVRTDMGGSGAPRNVEKGAETAVWLAAEAPAAATGKFWRDKREIPW